MATPVDITDAESGETSHENCTFRTKIITSKSAGDDLNEVSGISGGTGVVEPHSMHSQRHRIHTAR